MSGLNKARILANGIPILDRATILERDLKNAQRECAILAVKLGVALDMAYDRHRQLKVALEPIPRHRALIKYPLDTP